MKEQARWALRVRQEEGKQEKGLGLNRMVTYTHLNHAGGERNLSPWEEGEG